MIKARARGDQGGHVRVSGSCWQHVAANNIGDGGTKTLAKRREAGSRFIVAHSGARIVGWARVQLEEKGYGM